MSWKNKLENVKFTITTGDGKTYRPLWKNGEKSKDFNFAKFDFINQKGSLIDRKQAQSSSYPLVFWFTGDNNIDEAEEFERSAENTKQWTVTHPFYGTIKGHPVNIKRNDISFANTEITVDFWESLQEDYPKNSDSIKDIVRNKTEILNLTSAANYTSKAKPETSDILSIKSSIEISSARFQSDSVNFNEYRQITQKALKDIDNIVDKTSTAINSAQEVISFPARFDKAIIDKIQSIKSAYNEIKSLLLSGEKQSKHYFESQAATLLGTFAESAVNPQQDDYTLKSDVENVNNEILSLYFDYLQTLDNNQVGIQNIENEFAPDLDLQQQLIDLITFTSQSLFVLSFDAKKEKIKILKKDSNLILLTHELLSLDLEDENIKTFKRINNIKLNEIYNIKKGREIRYF